MKGPDDDEAEEEQELEEINKEITDPNFGKEDVTYYNHDGRKCRISDYSWSDNGC